MSEIEILGAGHGWLAVNKPAGISSHNDQGEDLLSIAARLMEERPELKTQTAYVQGFEPSPVHRLDRETSGVVLIATTAQAASYLGQAIEKREVKKLYRAVMRGSFAAQLGKWTDALSDRAEGRKNPKGSAPERKACETSYKVLRSNAFFSLVECDLITGRQHQIRRHAVLDRHQVVGDERYGDPRYVTQMNNRYGMPRLFLHASSLEFPSPLKGEKRILIECPEPKEFLEIMERSSLSGETK